MCTYDIVKTTYDCQTTAPLERHLKIVKQICKNKKKKFTSFCLSLVCTIEQIVLPREVNKWSPVYFPAQRHSHTRETYTLHLHLQLLTKSRVNYVVAGIVVALRIDIILIVILLVIPIAVIIVQIIFRVGPFLKWQYIIGGTLPMDVRGGIAEVVVIFTEVKIF